MPVDCRATTGECFVVVEGDCVTAVAIKGCREAPMTQINWSMPRPRHYLHGDYLEPADRRPDSVVYCAFCDGFCLPAHLHEEHEIDANRIRLNASKKVFYRTQQRAERPIDAANYFDGTPDPG